jgi:hypothetical protein
MSPTSSNISGKVLDKIKLWLFPVLVTILASVIYREILEVRADVKQLLAQSNVDKTRIELLEKQVQMLNQAVFLKRSISDNTPEPKTIKLLPLPGKHEEFYTYENNIKTEKQ